MFLGLLFDKRSGDVCRYLSECLVVAVGQILYMPSLALSDGALCLRRVSHDPQ